MSRFSLLAAVETPTDRGPRRRLRAGQTIADSAGNAQSGDVICGAMCASPTVRMVALDAAAVSDFAAVGITAVIGQVLSSPPGGVDSVDAATGSTEGDGNMRAKSGGGINSSVNKSVGVRGGKPTTNVISPRGVSEYGYATPGKLKAGAHTADNTSLNVFERKAAAAAQMGNAKALDVGKGGPGTGRTVLRSGGQGVHGPVAGPAPIQGRDI